MVQQIVDLTGNEKDVEQFMFPSLGVLHPVSEVLKIVKLPMERKIFHLTRMDRILANFQLNLSKKSVEHLLRLAMRKDKVYSMKH